MDEPRVCHACGVTLVGPFQPAIPLKRQPPAAEDSAPPVQTASAQSWICPACGLVAWVVPAEMLFQFQAERSEEAGPADDDGNVPLPYQRRTQMLRMLRRVRRM